MVFGLEHLVEERRRSAQSALGREPAPPTLPHGACWTARSPNAGNWLAVQGHRLEERNGEAEKPIAMTDPHRAETC
jgi:hypothetical protein